MFRRLVNTADSKTFTMLRLVLGVVFFAHGAQKALGWFGGYGFSGTMGFFTQVMHIPGRFAFLAVCAEFLGSIGLVVGVVGRVAAFGIACHIVGAGAGGHRPLGVCGDSAGTHSGRGRVV